MVVVVAAADIVGWWMVPVVVVVVGTDIDFPFSLRREYWKYTDHSCCSSVHCTMYWQSYRTRRGRWETWTLRPIPISVVERDWEVDLHVLLHHAVAECVGPLIAKHTNSKWQ